MYVYDIRLQDQISISCQATGFNHVRSAMLLLFCSAFRKILQHKTLNII
jgi:hypothetical protein